MTNFVQKGEIGQENQNYSSGIVLLHKEAGISSNSAVNCVKKLLSAKKCGHLGTLDLEAEGLLLVTVGSATKLFDFFLQKSKTYEAVFEFGYETDTLDLAGKVTGEKPCSVSRAELEKVCKEMVGRYAQMPPQYSAKKVGGKIAYNEARAGRKIELSPKEVEIFSCEVLDEIAKNKFKLQISCSSGTYIRSLARDIAEKLGTLGVMSSLLRTSCGQFELKDAVTLQQLKEGKISFVRSENLFDYEKIVLNEFQTAKLLNGQRLESVAKFGRFKLYGGKQFLGIGKVDENGLKLELRLM